MALPGSFCLLFALALAGYSFLAGMIGVARKDSAGFRLAETARRAGIVSFVAVTGAAIALVWAALNNDFSLAYILEHTNRALPTPYKLAALWSGQEGSLLFWSWLLAGYGFVLRLRQKIDPRLFAATSVILAGIQVFFLVLVTFVANPFGVMPNLAADGNGLNPLLQYPEMVIHPPMLYLGYVGFALPFSFALAALILRYPGEKWIHITRRWTMVTWLFLTCGIALGAHWAYSVLGWGGYWGWDPVENASLLPWLSGTAFLHSVMMQEKRGMMKVWNVWLVFVTFMLTILGTMLTRGGAVQSVHAFAQSAIGAWFYWFLGIIFLICLIAYFKNRDHLKSENKLESLVSRESSFLFNNLVLLAACFAVLCGTLFPILSEAVRGFKITVGAPFFNKVMVPIGLFLIFLTAVGPLLAWRKTSLGSIKRNFMVPAALSFGLGILLLFVGVKPWTDLPYFYAWLGFVLSALVVATVASEFIRGGRVLKSKRNTNLAAAMVHLTRRNMRRYGGYIVHVGVVLVIIGICGAAFNQEKEQEMALGDKLQIGHYTLVGQEYTQDDNANYSSEAAILDVYKDGKPLVRLTPEKREFKASHQGTTMVANHSTLFGDLYVIYEGKNPDTGHPIIKAFVNPLVVWIWIGVLVVAFGTGIALVPNAAAVKLPEPASLTVVAMDKAMQPAGAAK